MPEIKRTLAILLIEDNRADAFLTQEILNDSAVPNTVHVVHDAGKAFVHMSDGGSEAHLPDVILLDLNLPVMDGFAFLVEMAKEERLKYIPVFVLSASSARVDREKARKLGARGYLTKPLDLDQFENENSRAFQGSRAGMSKS